MISVQTIAIEMNMVCLIDVIACLALTLISDPPVVLFSICDKVRAYLDAPISKQIAMRINPIVLMPTENAIKKVIR